MENEKLVREAVGRVAYIGDLYDARSDSFCGTQIFKKAPPAKTIRLIDNPTSKTEVVISNKYSDKFTKLDIKAELKASIMAGLVKLEGSGKYFTDEKQSERAVRSDLIYNIQTKVEQINLFDEELKECFSFDALNSNKATHVVVEIYWGANSMVSMEYENSENTEKKHIEGALKAELDKVSSSFVSLDAAKADVDVGWGEGKKNNNFTLKIFADMVPSGEELPQTIEEVMAFMKKMPGLVSKSNDGKGKPLQYTMVSLSTLEKYLNINQNVDRLIKTLDEQEIIRFVQVFDDISIAKQQLNDLYYDMKKYSFCVRNEDIKKVGKTNIELDAAEANLRSKLSKMLIKVRSGKSAANELDVIRSKYESGKYSVEKVQYIISSYHNVVEKINFAKTIINEGVSYIGSGGSLESEQMKNQTGDIYVLFFNDQQKQTNQQSWRGNRDLLFTLLRSAHKESIDGQTSGNKPTKTTFIAVDLDVRPELAVKEGVGEGIRICHYKNGKYINFDVFSQNLTRESLCLAKSSEAMELVLYQPTKRVAIELRCPGSLSGDCENKNHTWTCSKCNQNIEHGFDGFFYCSCGRAPHATFEFKCSSEKHGNDFLQFSENNLIKLLETIKSVKEMNILFLGEPNVGKTTCINAIIDYMRCASFEEAEQFNMKANNNVNEATTSNKVTGYSKTEEPKAYVFEWGDTFVRLIDTPGIGDTRGKKQDKKNFGLILKYLTTLEDLHGVCILLKSNKSQLKVIFKFCIKELLALFHESASENFVFCFNNTGGTPYRQGETWPALRKILACKEVNIDLSTHTLYSMDNDPFCDIHNEVKFDEGARLKNSEIWPKSVVETNRMLNHIASLKPQVISKDIIFKHSAGKVIAKITKPIDEIEKKLDTGVAVAEDVVKNAENVIERGSKVIKTVNSIIKKFK